MAILAHKSEFITNLMGVLGLDPATTKGFTIRAYVNEVVLVDVEQYVSADDKSNTVLKRWKITKEEILEGE